jgi:hypothetical protein
MVANFDNRAFKVFQTDHPYNPELGNFNLAPNGDFYRVSERADVMALKKTEIGESCVEACLSIYQIQGVKEVILTWEYILVLKYVPNEWDEIEEQIKQILERNFQGTRFTRSSTRMPGLPVTS